MSYWLRKKYIERGWKWIVLLKAVRMHFEIKMMLDEEADRGGEQTKGEYVV